MCFPSLRMREFGLLHSAGAMPNRLMVPPASGVVDRRMAGGAGPIGRADPRQARRLTLRGPGISGKVGPGSLCGLDI